MADKNNNVESFKGTVTIGTSDTIITGTQTIGQINGVTKTIIFVIPTTQDTDTVNMDIVNSSDQAFFTSGTKGESTTNVIGSEVALIPGDKIVMTAEGTQSAAVPVPFDIRYLT